MSSLESSVASIQELVNRNVGGSASTEVKYTMQSEVYDPKLNARSKFQQKRRSRRVNKLKDMRKSGKDVPKKDPNPSKGIIVPTNQSSDFVHQTLLEKIVPPSVLGQVQSSLMSLNPDASVSRIMEVLEVIGSLAILLPQCTTPSQVLSQFVLAIRAMTTDSITENVLRQVDTIIWCKNLLGINVFENQSGDSSSASWLGSLPTLRENWDAIQHAPVFSKISNLISIAASVGLCSVTNLKWSYQGVDLFRVGTLQKHTNAIDLVGAFLDTIVCFIEGGYECFRTGSFEPLLFSNDVARELDELYFPLLELHEHAMVFNLHDKPVLIRGEKKVLNDIEYSQLLDEALDLCERAYKSARGTWQQGYLEKRRENLHRNRAAYQAKRIDGSMRFAPFTVYVWGESGVGKSTVSQVVMADCLNAAGANPDSKGVAVIKESDKFDSSLKGDTVGIFFDDMGNTKKEFLDKSPTERIIDINNNMITYANKADLHEKGKIEIRPRVFVITSNAPLADHGNSGSIKPFSIVRRADVHLEVKVKKQFQTQDARLDSNKVFEQFSENSLVNDIWDIFVYKPIEKSHGGNSSHLMSVYGGTNPHPVGIHETLKFLTGTCVSHFANQRRLIACGERLVQSRCYCQQCHLAQDICSCTDAENYEKQVSVSETFAFVREQFDAMGYRFSSLLGLVPHCVFDSKIVGYLYLFVNFRSFFVVEKRMRYSVLCSFMIMCWLSWNCMWYDSSFLFFPLLLASHVAVYLSVLAKWREDKLVDLANRKGIAVDMFASIRKSKMLWFFGACAAARYIYKIVTVVRGAHTIHQSALAPTNVATIEERDLEVNPWASPVASELHVSERASTMTHDQVCRKVSKNLLHGTFVENDFQQKCDVLALGGNLFLVPLHLFRNRNEMKAVFVRSCPTELNSTFRGIVSRSHMIPLEGVDLCIISVPSGGIFADIKHLFPSKLTANGSATFLYRDPSGVLRSDYQWIRNIKDSESGGPGYSYNLPYDTFTGLCMGTVVADYARSCIAGVHLKGVPDSPKGKALTVTRTMIDFAIARAATEWRSIFPSTSNGTFPVQRYEKQVLVDQDIDAHSPVNFMPVGSVVEYLGQGGQRSSHTKSTVRDTPISDTVALVTGVQNNFGPPKFNSRRMWQASLAFSANPSVGIEGDLLDKAYADYVDHLVTKFKSPDFARWVREELVPLTSMENVCGRDGKRFIDAMNKNTSKGFPLSGPKRDMITLLDPLDYPEFDCPAEVDSSILEEVARMEACFLNDERCYSIFKACVKDEPTKKGKDKVRVFQAADWATQIIIRKYFLPVARLLSMFPLDSECAVGVNAQGPEWDELARHMRSHGGDRIFAGDYSKYDLRMPAQLIISAFSALIEIAKECGRYSERDLIVMRGIATEVAYSCVAYNGDILIHSGSNPSGQNMTVYINCIVNSFLMRACYYHLYPANEKVVPFREATAMMTYGDDVKGSVKRGWDWFNHISYASFLAERDMVFTMPDKESVPTKYMSDEDADFLKRKNIFNEDTGLVHGALDESSIFKSLHTVLESKVVSLQDQSIANIDGALREWWQYGRDHYELRRSQMNEVAAKHGITQACAMLNEDYDDCLKKFRRKYFPEEEDGSLTSSSFSDSTAE